MKTIRFKLKALHNEEWFGLHTSFIHSVQYFGAAAVGLQGLVNRLLPYYDTANHLLQVLQKSIYTQDMETAHRERIEMFQGFYATVKGAQKLPDATLHTAARRLFNMLKGFRKSIINRGYAKISGGIHNLLQDLRKDYAGDVALLGLDDWVTSLEQAEQTFLAASRKRENESVAKSKGNLPVIRRQADAIYTAALNVLDAQLIADGLGGNLLYDEENEPEGPDKPEEERDPAGGENEVYKFVVDWNETVKKYRNLLHQRAGRKARIKKDSQ
jgi:hypothetical protein